MLHHVLDVVLVGKWTNTLDRDRLDHVLAGNDPFDERTMLDEEPEEVLIAADADQNPRTPD